MRRPERHGYFMSEQTLIMYAAPTLAGIKTGSLFMQMFDDEEQARNDIREYNKKFRKKGLCMIPVCWKTDRVLLYLFRPRDLSVDLEDVRRRQILEESGYVYKGYGQCLQNLVRRMKCGGEFPHEIGVFLGYPPEDVKGFIENHARNYKCSGLWKVYGDPETAMKMFNSFKKCTESYERQYASGTPLESLMVAG